MTPIDEKLELAALDVPFVFRRQAELIPSSLNIQRRVALLLLLVAKSHGSGASWKGLQLLNWVLRDDSHAELLAAHREGQDFPDRPIVRFEPALDRALALAVGFGLLRKKSMKVFTLTQAGQRVVAEMEVAGAFQREREILTKIGGRITQAYVGRILEWHSL